MTFEEWLKWREEYFKEKSGLRDKKELTKEQQMEAWEKYLNETDSGHRPS
jgi:hypothetical protein